MTGKSTKSGSRGSRTKGERTKADKAATLACLRQRIADHVIPPGARLREQDLVREFGLTRPHARDVIQALGSRGLVTVMPNNGAVVKRLDIAEVFNIYDVREVLEGLCARLATQNGKSELWAMHLERFGPALEEKIKAGDIEAYEEAFLALRRAIIDAADNSILTELLDIIYDRSAIILRRVLVLPGRVEKALHQQREIITFMMNGQAEEAEQARRRNFRSAIADLRKYQKFVL